MIASIAPDLAIHHFRNIHDTDSGFIHSVQFIYPSKQQGKALVKNYDLRIGGVILYIYSNIKLIIDHQNSVGDFNNRRSTLARMLNIAKFTKAQLRRAN